MPLNNNKGMRITAAAAARSIDICLYISNESISRHSDNNYDLIHVLFVIIITRKLNREIYWRSHSTETEQLNNEIRKKKPPPPATTTHNNNNKRKNEKTETYEIAGRRSLCHKRENHFEQ